MVADASTTSDTGLVSLDTIAATGLKLLTFRWSTIRLGFVDWHPKKQAVPQSTSTASFSFCRLTIHGLRRFIEKRFHYCEIVHRKS